MTKSAPPKQAQIATILLTCRDQPGIVASLAQLLYGYGAHILDSDQHADPVEECFFQRVRFDISTLHTDRAAFERALDEVAHRFDMRYRLSYGDERPRVAIMVSKYDHCLYELLLVHRAGELNCDVALIISNHRTAEPIAATFGVPFHHFEVTKETHEQVEGAQLALLEANQIDLIVLARYMRILSPRFVRAYSERTINIHHSFLPAFVGSRPYHQAFTRGVKLIGATAHYVTDELDEGPIIEQGVIRTSHRDSVRDLLRKGRDLERTVLAKAVRWHLQNRILIYGNKTVVFE